MGNSIASRLVLVNLPPERPLDNSGLFAIIVSNYLVSRRLTVLMDTTEGDTEPAGAERYRLMNEA